MDEAEGKSGALTFMSGDARAVNKLVSKLNEVRPIDWRIIGYLKGDSSLMISSSDPDNKVAIICSNTWYVKSQTHIVNPTFGIEVGKKKMEAGALSSRCYDRSLNVMMDDGSNIHQVICDEVCAIFFE